MNLDLGQLMERNNICSWFQAGKTDDDDDYDDYDFIHQKIKNKKNNKKTQ